MNITIGERREDITYKVTVDIRDLVNKHPKSDIPRLLVKHGHNSAVHMEASDGTLVPITIYQPNYHDCRKASLGPLPVVLTSKAFISDEDAPKVIMRQLMFEFDSLNTSRAIIGNKPFLVTELMAEEPIWETLLETLPDPEDAQTCMWIDWANIGNTLNPVQQLKVAEKNRKVRKIQRERNIIQTLAIKKGKVMWKGYLGHTLLLQRSVKLT